MDLSKLIAMTVPVEVHAERCIHHFSPRATCQKCVQYCPNHSIQFHKGKITLENCDGCGRCIQACTHNVFEMDFAKALNMPADKPLILACHQNEISDLPILSVGCLQQFTWIQLVILAKHFTEIVLYSDQMHCQSCATDWFPQGQVALIERYGLNAYLDKIRIIRARSALDEYIDEKFGDLNTRREYIKKQLNQFKNTAEKYTHQSLNGYLDAFRETIVPEQKLSFEKTQSQALLLNELYNSTPGLTMSEKIPLQSLANAQCRFCHICEKLCPWQAIAIVEEDGQAILAFHAVLCARCGLCIDICPEKGLLWNQGLTIKDIAHPHWTILANGKAKTCDCCGEIFYPTEKDQQLCLICQNKIY